MGASYLNVDLEVRSRVDLAPLVEALSGPLHSLYMGRERGVYLATFETAPAAGESPDKAIRRMVGAIAQLSGCARAL